MAVLALGLASIMLSGACAEPRLDVAQAAWRDLDVTVAEPTRRSAARLPLDACSDENPSSALVLARLGARQLALIADQDARTVRVVHPDTHVELSHRVVAGTPRQLVIGGDGRLYVALQDASRVVALEVGDETKLTLEPAGEIVTASEPVGLAVAPSGDTLLVASAWGKTLALYGLDDLRTRATVWLPREPRGVAVSADGRFAYVSHAVGPSVSRVVLGQAGSQAAARLERTEVTLSGRDYTLLADGRDEAAWTTQQSPADALAPAVGRSGSAAHLRVAAQGFAIARMDDQMIVPLVLVHPQQGHAAEDSTARYPTHQPALAMIATGDGTAWLRVQHRGWAASRSRGHFAGGARHNSCFLPRAVAVDRPRGTLLVGCLGTDEVVAYDGSRQALAKSWRGRWTVPAGPMGIAVDSAAGTALVWSQFDRSLATIALAGPLDGRHGAGGPDGPPRQPVRTTALPAVPARKDKAPVLSAEAAEGRKLFHGLNLRRGTAPGRSCASCHPDGREDGLVWPTPLGPRRTATLTGRGHDQQATGERAAGDGRPAVPACPQLGEGALSAAEVRALVSYLRSLPSPARTQHAAPSIDSDGRMATCPERDERLPPR